MTNDLPLQFDPVLFAKQGRKVSGQIAAKELPRVAEAVSKNDAGSISVTMSFSVSSLQFPMVQGTIEGSIVQTCQRCLQDAEVQIDQQFELLLINPQSQELASKEGYELFEYDGQFVSTLELIEDEVILAMPIVVKHEDISDCDPNVRKWLQQKKSTDVATKRSNPFESLKNLKI